MRNDYTVMSARVVLLYNCSAANTERAEARFMDFRGPAARIDMVTHPILAGAGMVNDTISRLVADA
jgi:hypothetical protein